MILPEETAADRVRAFLAERAPMRGLDPQHIHACNGAVLTVADLETLVAQADRLRSTDQIGHMMLEALTASHQSR